ncbi:MAG: glycosyltransferase family 4 protein [Acidimicrobiia bacterium]|nr:glycosyltransferase family 4 protein [Acidimicrobiia bacterium]
MANIWMLGSYIPALSDSSSRANRHHQFARALIAKGHVVTMFTSEVDRWEGEVFGRLGSEPYRDEIDGDLTIRMLPGRPYSSDRQRLLSMLHFERTVLKNTDDLPRPDLVLGATVPPFTAHAAQILAGRYRVPFVLELGDVWPATLVDMGALTKWHPAYWLLRLLEIRLYRKAARVVSYLPFAKIQVAASYADPGKVVWVPSAVALGPYVADDYPPAPPSREEFVVVYAGGLTPVYGLQHIVEAAALLAEQHPDLPITFRLVGSGNARSDLVESVNRLGLSNVEFGDPVPRDQVPAILADADVCIASMRDLPVVRKYGMSNTKVYEYLAAARPIIFSLGSANDPVAEAGAGISVPPESPQAIANAVVALYRMTREERIELGRRGQDFARNGYHIGAIGDRFTRVIDEVLEGAEPGSRVHPDDVRG